MIHWIQSWDRRGFATWELHAECSHWGLHLVAIRLHFETLGIPMYKCDQIMNVDCVT